VGRASPALAAFNAGEFAPQMEGRTDVEKYAIACHIQQNFIALKQGPSTFRQGTAYVQPVKNSANKTWLQRFEFSQTQAFVLEFGGNYCRFYTLHGPELILISSVAGWSSSSLYAQGAAVSEGGVVYYCNQQNLNQNPSSSPAVWVPTASYAANPLYAIYEVYSPYAAADLTDSLGEFTLQIVQSGDVLYIAGGYAGTGPAGVGYPPYTLTRMSNSPPLWTLAQYSPPDGPYAPELPIVANQNIALTVSAVNGNGITINAYGGNVFAATDVGRLVRIGSQQFNVTPWVTNVAWNANTQCSNNGNNYTALANGTSGAAPPVQTSGVQPDGPNVGTNIDWLYTDSGYGVAQITAYVSPTQVTANVLTQFPRNVVGQTAAITAISQANPCVVTAAQAPAFPLGGAVFIVGAGGMTQVNQNVYTDQVSSASTVTLAGVNSTNYSAYTSGGTIILNASTEWQLGAWSNTTEWPRANAFFKDRLFWAGKLYVWGSVVGNYSSHAPDEFGVQTTNSAMNELVSGSDASDICWLSSAIILLIGTEGGEYGLDAASYSTSPLGPANVEILRQSNWRCRHITPFLSGTTVLYVQRAGRKVFAMDYNFYLNRYDSTDQSKYSYHLSIGGLTGMAYMQEPWSILWATRSDGTLLSYTFNREDNVTAWCRHNMGNGGLVESVAVIPAPDASRDELWMIVNRTVNGAVVRTVEYMVKQYDGPQGGYAGDAQNSAWYVDCGVQYQAPQPVVITNCVLSIIPSQPIRFTLTAANSFSAGQPINISGILGTGSTSPNGSWVVETASAGQFTIRNNNILFGSFAYSSGGTASASSSAGTTTITGLPAVMYNQTVNVLADGGVQPQQVVSGTGSITLSGTFQVVTIGFPYQGNLVPMRPEGGADIGTAQGKRKQGANLVLRLVDTGGGQVAQLSNISASRGVYQDPLGQQTLSDNAQNFENIRLNDTATELDSPPLIQSGDYPISFPLQQVSDQDESDLYILVQQPLPLPMTVVGLYPSYKVEEFQ
jgi:hypothetical protein